MKVKLKLTSNSKHPIYSKNTTIECVNFIQNMLLCNKIRLSDIPQALRMIDISIYLTALRISRNISQNQYQEDLKIMKMDINKLPLSKKKQWLHYYYDSMEAVKYCVK